MKYAKYCKVIVDYEPDVDEKPERSDPDDEPVAQEGEKNDFNAEMGRLYSLV